MGFIMFWLGFIIGSVPGLIVSRKLRKRHEEALIKISRLEIILSERYQEELDKISKKEGE